MSFFLGQIVVSSLLLAESCCGTGLGASKKLLRGSKSESSSMSSLHISEKYSMFWVQMGGILFSLSPFHLFL